MFDIADVRGSIAPVITPFDDSGRVAYDVLSSLIERQISSGSHGISVTGTTGEPASLTISERKDIIREAHSATGGRVPFVPGTGTNNIDETIELSLAARGVGADALLVIVPYYSCPSQDGLFRYFNEVAGRVEMPVIVYNIPGRTGVNLTPETMTRLRSVAANIVGVKESNRDFEHVNAMLKACGREFQLYSGIELLCFPMLAVGAVGYISATANLLPAKVAELYNRFSRGDLSGARDLHFDLMALNRALFLETNPGPLKWAMREVGLIDGGCRLPLSEPSAEVKRRLELALQEHSEELEITTRSV
jgi:4-hydroxy-tetrahydrodipicolinate synthase